MTAFTSVYVRLAWDLFIVRRMLWLVPACLLVYASPAAAQSLKWPTVAFAAAAASDQASTVYSWHRQPTFTEQDPLIRWIGRNSTMLIATGSAVDLGTLWLAHRLHRSHPKLATTSLYALAAIRGSIAARNVYRANTFARVTF